MHSLSPRSTTFLTENLYSYVNIFDPEESRNKFLNAIPFLWFLHARAKQSSKKEIVQRFRFSLEARETVGNGHINNYISFVERSAWLNAIIRGYTKESFTFVPTKLPFQIFKCLLKKYNNNNNLPSRTFLLNCKSK